MVASHQKAGFSIIEVLVAVALIGVALLPLVVIQSQVAQSHARYQADYRRATLQKNALEILREMNPSKSPEGRFAMDDAHTLTWTSSQITEVTRSTDYPIGDGYYDVALYRVEVVIVSSEGQDKLSFSTEKVGWTPAVGIVQPTDPIP